MWNVPASLYSLECCCGFSPFAKASFAFWTACGWGEKSFAKHRAVGLILHSQAGTPPPACGSEPKTATPSLLKCSRTNLFPSRSRPALFSVLFFCVAEPRLLERDEPRGFGGADTGATVRDRLVCDGELAEVVASHLRLQSDRKHNRQRLASPLSTTWKWRRVASSQIYPRHDDDMLARRYISDEGGWVGGAP